MSIIILCSTLFIQPVQSKPLMDTINELEQQSIKHIEFFNRFDITDLKRNNYKNNIRSIIKNEISNYGLISWIIELLKKLIELLKRPFEKMRDFFETLAVLFEKLVSLMTDIIDLIDWLVRKAIIGVIISIIYLLIEFTKYIIDLIEEYNEDNPDNSYKITNKEPNIL